MKKSFKALAVSLLAAAALAGCGGDTPAPDWSGADKDLMAEHLYGMVLPYVSGSSNMTIEWDSTQGCVVVSSDKLASSSVASFATQFKSEDGWVDLNASSSDSVAQATESEEESFYLFEKEFSVTLEEETDPVKRWIQVQFGNKTSSVSETETETKFYLYAGDPYYYDLGIEDFVSNIMDDDFEIPNFDSERYFFNQDNSEYICFSDSDNPAADWKTILDEDGTYEVVESADAYAEFSDYHFNIVEQDSEVYFGNCKEGLYVGVSYWLDGWPDKRISEGLSELVGIKAEYVDDFPEFEADYIYASFSSESFLGEVFTVVSVAFEDESYEQEELDALVDAYIDEKLSSFAKIVDEEEVTHYISPNKLYSFSIDCYANDPMYGTGVDFYFDVYDGEFPAYVYGKFCEEYSINNSLPVPQFTADSFEFHWSDTNKVFMVNCSNVKGTETKNALEVYQQQLAEALYVASGDPIPYGGYTYYPYKPSGKPDHTVYIGFKAGEATEEAAAEDELIIEVDYAEVSTDFPSDKVNEAFGFEESPYPTIALDKVDYYQFLEFEKGEDVEVHGFFLSPEDASEAVTTVCNLFKNSEDWTEIAEGQYYLNANKNFRAYVGVASSNAKMIYVAFQLIVEYDTSLEAMAAAALKVYGNAAVQQYFFPDFADESALPEHGKWIIQGSSSSSYAYYVVAQFEDEESAEAAAQAYAGVLESNPYYSYYEQGDSYDTYDVFVEYYGWNYYLVAKAMTDGATLYIYFALVFTE